MSDEESDFESAEELSDDVDFEMETLQPRKVNSRLAKSGAAKGKNAKSGKMEDVEDIDESDEDYDLKEDTEEDIMEDELDDLEEEIEVAPKKGKGAKGSAKKGAPVKGAAAKKTPAKETPAKPLGKRKKGGDVPEEVKGPSGKKKKLEPAAVKGKETTAITKVTAATAKLTKAQAEETNAITDKEEKKDDGEKKPKKVKLTEEEIIGDIGEFFSEFQGNEKKQAKTEISNFLTEIISSNSFPSGKKEEYVALAIKNKLNKPGSHLSYMLEIIHETFKKASNSSNLTDLAFQVMNTTLTNFYQPIPCIQESMFFPNKENEVKLARILRRAKVSLDVCVFTFTNDRFYRALDDAWDRGVKVRVISDDTCSKFIGADIYRLALKGVPCTTDNNLRLHMHNKFAIIDEFILVTGSFNWTSQAVVGNQENLIVVENKQLTKEYQEEFDKLWVKFEPQRITNDMAKERLNEENQALDQREAARLLKKEAKKKEMEANKILNK